MKKVCKACVVEKDLSEFYSHQSNRDGLHHECKSCVKARVARNGIANPHKRAASQAKWKAANPERNRGNRLRWHYQANYGISHEDFLAMCKSADNKCQICRTELTRDGKGTCILCRRCNTGIGFLRDDPALATKAAEYLA